MVPEVGLEQRFDYREESDFARESFRLYFLYVPYSLLMRTNIVFRIYIAVATIVGLVGSLISLGVLFSTLLNHLVITDEEYLTNRGGYEYQCTPENLKIATGSTAPQKTYDQCMEDAKKQSLTQRSLETKQTGISSAVWGLLSLLIFIPHFRFIYRYRTEDDNKATKKEA